MRGTTTMENGLMASREEATAEFCGSLVRLDCGTEGVFQGIVIEVDPVKTHIKIENPFRNGVFLNSQIVQIPGDLIKDVLVVRTTPAFIDILGKMMTDISLVRASSPERVLENGKAKKVSDIRMKQPTVSSNVNSPRQRRITCAERMLMNNQCQQKKMNNSGGSSVRSGAQTYGNRNRQFTPRSPSVQQKTVQIYMQSGKTRSRTLMASLPSRNNDSRFSSSKASSSKANSHLSHEDKTKQVPATALLNRISPQTPGSVKIMKKLFSPVKSEQTDSNKVVSNQHQNVSGQRIDVNDLLRGCSSADVPFISDRSSEPPPMSRPGSSASTGSAHSVGYVPSPHRRPSPTASVQSDHYKRLSPPVSSSPPSPTIRDAPLAHEAFGEFKLFKEQRAMPTRLHVNHQRNIHGQFGPTGIPAVDCSNGYRSYSDRRYAEKLLGDPQDPNMETDFDFAGNLALFDRAEFNRETDDFFQGLDSGGDSSRNYRNDENVLQDSSRVISWTKSTSTASEILPPSSQETALINNQAEHIQ